MPGRHGEERAADTPYDIIYRGMIHVTGVEGLNVRGLLQNSDCNSIASATAGLKHDIYIYTYIGVSENNFNTLLQPNKGPLETTYIVSTTSHYDSPQN